MAISVIPRPGVESVKMFYFNGINVAPSYTEVPRKIRSKLLPSNYADILLNRALIPNILLDVVNDI